MIPISSPTSLSRTSSTTRLANLFDVHYKGLIYPYDLFCKENRENMKTILASKNVDAALTTRILNVCFIYKNICNAQDQLNEAIKEITAKGETVNISDHVRRMLRDLGIDVLQNSDETIELTPFVATVQLPQRASEIDTVVSSFLTSDLARIVKDYDAQIKICPANCSTIHDMLSIGGSAKESVVTAAHSQGQSAYLLSFNKPKLTSHRDLGIFEPIMHGPKIVARRQLFRRDP